MGQKKGVGWNKMRDKGKAQSCRDLVVALLSRVSQSYHCCLGSHHLLSTPKQSASSVLLLPRMLCELTSHLLEMEVNVFVIFFKALPHWLPASTLITLLSHTDLACP